jgi:hypothetical protein
MHLVSRCGGAEPPRLARARNSRSRVSPEPEILVATMIQARASEADGAAEQTL